MNLHHRNFGQQYRLSRLAVRLRTFTVSELIRLTGIVDDTVYGFVSKLMQTPREHLQWEELPRTTRGRPVKRYTLTEAGVDYLLERNARLAAILGGEPANSTESNNSERIMSDPVVSDVWVEPSSERLTQRISPRVVGAQTLLKH